MIKLEISVKNIDLLTTAVKTSLSQASEKQRPEWESALELLRDARSGHVEIVECKREGCKNPVENSKSGRKAQFCSDACRQKAYRDRQKSVTKQTVTDLGVTKQNVTEYSTVESTQRQTIQQLESHPTLVYYRKGRGVVHLAHHNFLSGATFCGKDVSIMTQVNGASKLKICQRCSAVRDTQRWWRL